MYEVFAGMLKMNGIFRKSMKRCHVTYELEADYTELIRKYGLKEVAGEGTDEEKMFRMLDWMTEHVKHKGNYDGHVRDEAIKLLEYAFDTEEGINCRSLSIALTECLLAVGIKARAVFMLPFSPYDCDNHVVCEAWAANRSKWIMLDPTYGSGVFYRGEPQSVGEVRSLLADRKEISFSEKINYNGSPVDEKDLKEYYAKDMFWFQVGSVQGCHSGIAGRCSQIFIVPKGFDEARNRLLNVEYRMELFGEQEWLKRWKESILKNRKQGIYKDLDFLYR